MTTMTTMTIRTSDLRSVIIIAETTLEDERDARQVSPADIFGFGLGCYVSFAAAFRKGLGETGYVEARNVADMVRRRVAELLIHDHGNNNLWHIQVVLGRGFFAKLLVERDRSYPKSV